MTENLYDVLFRPGLKHSDSVFLHLSDGVSVTYQEMDGLAKHFAGFLAGQGLKPGDRIVSQLPKSIAALVVYLGCLRAGVIFIPLNTAYTPAEVQYFLEDSGAKLFFTQCVEDIAPGASKAVSFTDLNAPAIIAKDLGEQTRSEVYAPSEEDVAAICYTSGTTGLSKGAILTHKNLISNAKTLHDIWGFEPGDVLLHALPVFHVHGLFVALHTAMINASRVIFLDRFSPDIVCQYLPQSTVFMGVPTFYTRLLAFDGFQRDMCSGMRLFTSGSAPMTRQTHQLWQSASGHQILERYGMTEAGMITSNPYAGDRVPGTVGFGLPDVDVRVCDEAGAEVPRGEVGIIEARGPNIFKGYWNKPQKTKEDLRDNGFLITGDLGVMDEDGRVSIVGRAKDLIIAGGYNIYPKEIEQVLDDIDGVKESAVIGVPHPDMGEGVVAVIVASEPPPTFEQIQIVLNDRLARFKHPRAFKFVEELPRNAMSKVQKAALRERFKAAFEGNES